MPDVSAWRTASRCDHATCVEVALVGDQVLVRDSKQLDGPVLTFTAEEWDVFVAGIRNNEFDV